MIVEANRHYNTLKTHHEVSMTFWQNNCNNLYNNYMTPQRRLLCGDCRNRQHTEPEGGRVKLCQACTDLLQGIE